MNITNKKVISIFIVLSLLIIGLVYFLPKKEVELGEVKLDIPKNTNNSFAIYIDDGEGGYKEQTDNNSFPTDGYVLNESMSGCMDTYGNDVKDVLNYEENVGVSVNTNKTLYCYLYFDESLGLEIIKTEPNGLNLNVNSSSADWTGMYRFQGRQKDGIDNYICFGTSDSGECKEHPDKYMYRIIGIEESGRIKVIKKEALKETDQWWTDYNTSKHWTDSKVYADINGTTFLNDKNYVPTGWENKIDTNHWLFGSMHSNNQTQGARQSGIEVYKIESGQKEAQWDEKANSLEEEYHGVKAQSFTTTNGSRPGTEYYYIRHTEKWSETLLPHEVDAKIGLMNLSDYYLSISNDANCQLDNHTYENICNTGWMHLSQNDTNNPPSPHEWTMSRYGWNIYWGVFDAYSVYGTGYASTWNLSSALSVRPVFYLKADNVLKEGFGTETEPFIIS